MHTILDILKTGRRIPVNLYLKIDNPPYMALAYMPNQV